MRELKTSDTVQIDISVFISVYFSCKRLLKPGFEILCARLKGHS